MSVIRTSNLGKRYGSQWALRGCELAVPQGEVVALVGPNGAGKTTLQELLVGLTVPTTGSIALFGSVQPAAASARVGFVAQDAPLYQHLSVAAMVRLARQLNISWDVSFAERRLADLGIPLDRKVGKLSGGQQAQLALTLALAPRPDLLVLDEPLARLDPLARHDFMSTLMMTVAQDGLSVLFSSHAVSELERVSSFLILLSSGQVRLCGGISDLTERHAVLIGPAGDQGRFTGRLPAVSEQTAGRQVQLLVKGVPPGGCPAGWEMARPTLEELVLAYLRNPGKADTSMPPDRPTLKEVNA